MKHGIPPSLAISALVPRVAAKTVADLVYSAEEIDASSAFAAGLISRVVPDGELDAAADRFLDGLRQYDVAAIRVIKGYIGKAGRLDPEAASDLAGYTLATARSEEHTSELQSLMRIQYAVFCLKKNKNTHEIT